MATIAHHTQLGTAGLRYRLPTIFSNKSYLEGGGLMSYGPDIVEIFRRSASYFDRVLRGTKPADLPVEQQSRFELALNLPARVPGSELGTWNRSLSRVTADPFFTGAPAAC